MESAPRRRRSWRISAFTKRKGSMGCGRQSSGTVSEVDGSVKSDDVRAGAGKGLQAAFVDDEGALDSALDSWEERSARARKAAVQRLRAPT